MAPAGFKVALHTACRTLTASSVLNEKSCDSSPKIHLVRRQVAITDAEVRRGMLMLRSENVVVLGGQVNPGPSLQDHAHSFQGRRPGFR